MPDDTIEELLSAPPEAALPAYTSSAADEAFLAELRRFLAATEVSVLDQVNLNQAFARSSFPQRYERLGIVVYAPKRSRLVTVRRRVAPFDSFAAVALRIRGHKRAGAFDFGDAQRCRIQLEFISEPPVTVDIRSIGMTATGDRHFEIGVDGLTIGHQGKVEYFFPGDAYVRSIMGMQQLRAYIGRRLLRVESFAGIVFKRFRSESYVSAGQGWLRLYRGHPLVGPITADKLRRAVQLSIEHMKRTQRDNGQFLYYYDAATDSRLDHEHPNRHPERNPYYNILRHVGGGLVYFFYLRLTGDESVLPYLRRSLDFLVQQIHVYCLPDGGEAGYVYYNRKGKLGAAGIALYLLAEYRNISGDDSFRPWAQRLCRHLLAQVSSSGEFIYYFVYLDRVIDEQSNQDYFSFYYPGEAVVGLACYYKYLCEDEAERALIRDKLTRALHYLVVDRPGLRAEHYTAVPSDSWLMMGIMEMWDIPEMRDPRWSDFVFRDADAMVARLYRPDDAPYPDYAGAFYYQFGDYPYSDGARCEGLTGAYELALKCGEQRRARLYGKALRLAAWSTYHLVNTPESIYAAQNPDIACGGIRFKYTRQWFRVDTIQHVASFFCKFLPYWERSAGAAAGADDGGV